MKLIAFDLHGDNIVTAAGHVNKIDKLDDPFAREIAEGITMWRRGETVRPATVHLFCRART